MSDAILRQWAATWAQAGQEMAELERRALETMTDAEAAAAAIAVLSSPVPPGAGETGTSGLVEQQRSFARLRKG